MLQRHFVSNGQYLSAIVSYANNLKISRIGLLTGPPNLIWVRWGGPTGSSKGNKTLGDKKERQNGNFTDATGARSWLDPCSSTQTPKQNRVFQGRFCQS